MRTNKTTKKSEPQFEALKAESDRVGWPTSFMTDLTTHDRNTLSVRDPKEPFAWILCDHGTHIAFPGPLSDVPRLRLTQRGSTYASMVAKTFGDECCRFYFWDGYALIQQRTAADLDERMYEVENPSQNEVAS